MHPCQKALAWKVTGSGQPVSSFVLPYNGQQLKGSQLDQQCDPCCCTDGKSRVTMMMMMMMMMMLMMASVNEVRHMRLGRHASKLTKDGQVSKDQPLFPRWITVNSNYIEGYVLTIHQKYVNHVYFACETDECLVVVQVVERPHRPLCICLCPWLCMFVLMMHLRLSLSVQPLNSPCPGSVEQLWHHGAWLCHSHQKWIPKDGRDEAWNEQSWNPSRKRSNKLHFQTLAFYDNNNGCL